MNFPPVRWSFFEKCYDEPKAYDLGVAWGRFPMHELRYGDPVYRKWFYLRLSPWRIYIMRRLQWPR